MTLADDVEARVHHQLLEGARAGARPPSRATIVELVRREAPLLGAGELDTIVRHVSARTAGLGPLEALLGRSLDHRGDGQRGRACWIERAAGWCRTGLALDDATVAPPDRAGGGATGLASRSVESARRRPAPRRVTGQRGGAAGRDRRSVPHDPPLRGSHPRARRLLLARRRSISCIRRSRRRRNILVTGGTGSGKTTLLNSLAACLPSHERIVTVEDAAELRLPGEHVVRLEARPANAEGVGAVTIRELVRNALRMRPDRIVVGEVRGAEALDMLQAMNTGHEGSLSTCPREQP